MDKQTKRVYAQELAQEFLESYDFLGVTENEDLAYEEGVTDQDMEDIFDLIINATVVIPDVDES